MSGSCLSEIDGLVPVLKQTVRLREEPQGAVLINDDGESYGRYLLASSFEGFLLSLFDGTRAIRDIARIFASLRNSPVDNVIQRDIYTFAQQRMEFVEFLRKPLEDSRIQVDPLKFLSKPHMFSVPVRPYRPLWVDFYVTRECNLKCIYCFTDSKYVRRADRRQRLRDPRSRMYNLVDQLATLDIKRVLVTGGEPTLLSYLSHIISRLTNHGIEVILATNACLMSDKMALELREAGLKKVQAKLDAASPGIQDELSGIDGSFTELIEGIRILKKHSFRVSVASVATALNIREVPQAIRICADLGVDEVSPRIYTSGIWALYGRGGADLNPPYSSITWLEQEIGRLQDSYSGIIKISSFDSSLFSKKRENEVPRCPGFISSCTILDNGLVVPCETLADFSDDFVIGDANKKTLIDIWNSEKAESWVMRRSPKVEDPCSSCDEFDRCKGGCPWKAYVAYGSWSCDPYCIRAPRPTKIPFPETSQAAGTAEETEIR